MLGDVFLHIFPYISQEHGFTTRIGLYVLLGVMIFFVIEKFIHWHHCHRVDHTHAIKPFAYTNLIGDGVHNFLDGVIIAASFMVSVPVGLATTLAVLFHEIPQEVGDFGVLLYAGFKRKAALLWNFASALMGVLGAVVALLLIDRIQGLELVLMSIAAGGFIYIAGSDLIPELHKNCHWCKSLYQFLFVILGIVVMGLLFFVE
jgi:zinc and cadmium transporter